MGTNYYMYMRNKIAKEKDGVLVDSPDFGYMIHLNKLSYGWKPLFQFHEGIRSFADLEDFYFKYKDEAKIFDEYDREFTWKQYKERVIKHSQRKPVPQKWVYKTDEAFSCINNGRPFWQTVECEPEEADLWIPFSHREYMETHDAAMKKSTHYEHYYFEHEMDYTDDPDYNFDWVSGDFS